MSALIEFAGWLNKTTWLNLIFFVLAILGVLLSYVFYRRSKKDIQPCYQFASVSLLASGANSVKDLKILHKGIPIDRLSVATVSFWNTGAAVLEASDVAPADPLRIILREGTRVLQASVATQSAPSNNVRISVDAGVPRVRIEFDYLARNEGFAIEIFHDAVEADFAILIGTIKGVKEIRRVTKGDDVISDTYIFPIYSRIWTLTGGPKKPLFWITAPLWFIPMLCTLLLDMLIKPARLLLGPSKDLNAHKRIERLK